MDFLADKNSEDDESLLNLENRDESLENKLLKVSCEEQLVDLDNEEESLELKEFLQ